MTDRHKASKTGLPITYDQWDDLSARIIDVRDRYHRHPNDADTDAIIEEAILPFLREVMAQAWEEGSDAAYYDPEIRGFVACGENPYRSSSDGGA